MEDLTRFLSEREEIRFAYVFGSFYFQYILDNCSREVIDAKF